MIDADRMQLLHQVDRTLCRLSYVRYNYFWLTPLNIDEEFDKFESSGGSYVPQFRYPSFSVRKEIGELESLDIPVDTPLGRLFDRIRNDFLVEARALDAIGTDWFDTTSLFSPPDDYVVSVAYDILSRFPSSQAVSDNPKRITPRKLGESLLSRIRSYGLSGWTVEYGNYLSSVSVSSGTRTVRIKKGVMFSKKQLDKLLIHEVGTHILRMENGHRQRFRIFAHGLPGYLPTEEGLAGYNERRNGLGSAQIERAYALRALATHLSVSQGFVQVYDGIRPFVDDDYTAFLIVTRAKRGLGDTSRPGGYLKDHCYLQGKLLIEEFLARGGDVTRLYVGKIGVDDLWLVDEGVVHPPRYLPSFLVDR
ncbi:MAG: tyrosine/phenylalanine carboxypeptidase domain-containing protein [Nanoarchaeota archaeon]